MENQVCIDTDVLIDILRAAHIGARLEAQGNALESRDLFTGAIALEHGFALKTRNAKHFSRIPGLTVL